MKTPGGLLRGEMETKVSEDRASSQQNCSMSSSQTNKGPEDAEHKEPCKLFLSGHYSSIRNQTYEFSNQI